MKKLIIMMALMMCFITMSFGQLHLITIDRPDSIYFLDGGKPQAVFIVDDWNETSYVSHYNYSISSSDYEYYFNDDEEKSLKYINDEGETYYLMDKMEYDKSKIHYIYDDGEYYLINVMNLPNFEKRISKNLNLFQKRSKHGLIVTASGIGTLLIGNIIVNHQVNNSNFDTNIVKYFNYGGLSLMLIGTTIQLTSFKFIKRSTVNITPHGIKVNF